MRNLFVVVITLFSTCSVLAKESFSTLAWQKVAPIYTAIQEHPYNQAMIHGNLDKKYYQLYLEQDAYYLTHYYEDYLQLANKIDSPKDKEFIKAYAKSILQETSYNTPHHNNKLTKANFMYVNYLDATSHSSQSAAVTIAALLPCIVIYEKLASWMLPQMSAKNPYTPWVKFYAMPDNSTTEQITTIANKLYDNADDTTKAAMLNAYTNATKLEYLFWDDIYYKNYF